MLRGLLREQVPIRDLTRILEAVTAKARSSREIDDLLEVARSALGAVLSAQVTVDGTIRPITIDPVLEQRMIEAVRSGESGAFLALDPVVTEGFLTSADEQIMAAERLGHEPAIVCSASLRPVIKRLLRAGRPRLRVLSFAELTSGVPVEPLGVINVEVENV